MKKERSCWVIIGILIFSSIVATFNETALNVALIPISESMSVTMSAVQWLITGYMLVTAIMVPVTAFLFQSFSTKRLYIAAMLIVLIGGIGCLLSVNFPMLLAFRMFQAAGTGMIIPVMTNTTLAIAPKEKIGTAMALCVCGTTLGPAFGPTISGIIAQVFPWKAIFVLIICLSVIALILGSTVMRNVSELTKPHLDILSVVLSAVGLLFFLYGLSIVSGKPLTGILFIVVGFVVLVFFYLRQQKLETPMLDFRPFKYPIFIFGVVMLFISFMFNFTLNALLPSYFQSVMGVTSMVSALILLPGVLLNALSTGISGKILDRYGAKGMLLIGFGLTTVALFAFSFVGAITKIILIIVIHIIIYQGVALTMSPAQTSALAYLPKELNPHGVSLATTFQQISASVGTALFGGVQIAMQQKKLNQSATELLAVSESYRVVFLVATLISVIGLMVAIVFCRRKKDISCECNISNSRNRQDVAKLR